MAEQAASSKPPLAGVMVVELTTMITGPLAGMLLADLGADVIKIESPQGDPFRTFREGNYSPHFCSFNRNKRSVVLDLQSDHGRGALRALLQKADVMLANFRPGTLDRLGFGDAVLKTLNPRLIRCEINGFGKSGPYVARPAYDAVAQGLSGLSSLFVDPAEPELSGPTISDNITGHYACYGILAALFQREKTGEARRVDVNMLEATVAFIPDAFGYYTQMGLVPEPHSRPHTSQSYVFACSDQKLVTVHLSSQPKFWTAFTEALGRQDLLDHPDLQTRMSRIENYALVRALASGSFQQHSRSYWLERLARHDIPSAPVYSIPEVFDDPQVRHLDTFQVLEHEAMGLVTSIRRPVRFDGKRDDQPSRAPPLLGEHTTEVLRECRPEQDDLRSGISDEP